MPNIEQMNAVSVERQLGELVGTVKMLVSAVDSLRDNVEVLAERAAVKADLDKTRSEIRAEAESDRRKISELQRWMWLTNGAVTAVTIIINYFKPFSSVLGVK